jgi:hypothetical protein
VDFVESFSYQHSQLSPYRHKWKFLWLTRLQSHLQTPPPFTRRRSKSFGTQRQLFERTASSIETI